MNLHDWLHVMWIAIGAGLGYLLFGQRTGEKENRHGTRSAQQALVGRPQKRL